MKLTYFGAYERDYPRNQTIIKGLRQNGVEVQECNDSSSILLRYPRLITKYTHSDAIFVGTGGHTSMPLARLLAKYSNCPLVLDPFISFYEDVVGERHVVKENSISAKYYYFLDKYMPLLADSIIFDTDEHARYFNREFGTPMEKAHTVYIGTDDEKFYPDARDSSQDVFNVLFYGSLLPLHGVRYIIEAAELLRDADISFRIIGPPGTMYNELGQTLAKKSLDRVKLSPSIPYSSLCGEICRADICLGIFGDTPQAKRVIPNKVFEAMACKKPVITMDTPAVKEIFANKRELLLCDNTKLADSIYELYDNKSLREHIAKKAYESFISNFTPKHIGSKIIKIIENC